MRTNIEIDDTLMAQAMQAGGYTTKRETVEAALKVLAQRKRAYAALLAMGGTVDWQGDLDAWRTDKPRPAYGTVAAKKVSKTGRKAKVPA